MAKKELRRAKGKGCLIKRGNIYTARWVKDGKVYVRSTEESDKKEAAKKLAEFLEPFAFKNDADKLAAISKKIDTAEVRADDLFPALTLTSAFKAYVDSPNRPDSGPRTMADYECQFNKFIKWVEENHPGVKEMRHITKDIAFQFAGHLGTTLTPNSFNKYVALLRRVWKVLEDHKDARLKLNPWEKIEPKTLTTHSRRELTVKELTSLIEASSGEMRLLLAFGIYCGFRLGDAALIQHSNCDMDRRLITITPQKTERKNKTVKIYIHNTLFNLLNEIPKSKRKGYVMPGIAARYQSSFGLLARDITKLFNSVGIETTVESAKGLTRRRAECGYHSLRHCFVSLCASGGVSQSVVQSLVGHGSPAMTQHYTHIDAATTQRAIATLPSIGGAIIPVEATDATESEIEAVLLKLSTMTKEQLKKVVKQAQSIIKTK